MVLCANKLSLNIEKPVLWYSILPQSTIAPKLNLSISNMSVRSDNHVKYLELIFYLNLNWKPYLHELNKKVSRGIGLLSKIIIIRYFVSMRNILHQ